MRVPFSRGMSYGYRALRGEYAPERVAADATEMARWGIDSVALHVHVAQETFASTRLFADFVVTPTDAEIAAAIRAFRDRGIRVMVKPMIDLQDSSWQGNIRFPRDGDEQIAGVRTDYWAHWFASFAAALRHYATLAAESGAEAFCVGCELVGMMEQAALWTTTVRSVREVFPGVVTYDTDHSALEDPQPWFRELDVLSVSYYVPTAQHPGASVDEMRAQLVPAVAALEQGARELGIPVLFGEIGCRSRAGAALEPSDYRLEGAYDGGEQAAFLEAILSTFWDRTWWRGLYWWKWEERQDRPQYRTDPSGDMGFTLQGKPGERVLRAWYARDDR